MSWLRKFIQRFGCAHEYEFVRNIYGDEIHMHNGKRSIWKCYKCDKVEYRDDLYYVNNNVKLKDKLNLIYQDYYDSLYNNWKCLRQDTLDRLVSDMKKLSYKGYKSYDVVLTCEDSHNDKYYFEKWFKDNDLTYSMNFIGRNDDEKMTAYKINISW